MGDEYIPRKWGLLGEDDAVRGFIKRIVGGAGPTTLTFETYRPVSSAKVWLIHQIVGKLLEMDGVPERVSIHDNGGGWHIRMVSDAEMIEAFVKGGDE